MTAPIEDDILTTIRRALRDGTAHGKIECRSFLHSDSAANPLLLAVTVVDVTLLESIVARLDRAEVALEVIRIRDGSSSEEGRSV